MDRSARRFALRLAQAGVLTLCLVPGISAQRLPSFSRADSLRGSDGPARSWWDVTYYDLDVHVQPSDSSLAGRNAITYRVVAGGDELQIDLQPPMSLDSLMLSGRSLPVRRDGNAWFARIPETQPVGSVHRVTAFFHGKPVVAVRPPWDGGYQWETDASGEPWVATSNQGLGASVWWPNKDLQSEEPDSQRIVVTVPDPLVDVSNGRLRSSVHNGDGTTTFEWFVSNPVNNYSVSVNAGSYAHWTEELEGERGTLTMDFWPLAQNLGRAREQWTQARTMMQCFEHWFGPYPWYEDGYKLVEVPYLGMEHQSAVTYGNGYRNGYRGTDLSGTGWGLEWDFIIVHESAHEWWGNNITARDIADNWVHESFANYAENLYTECLTGTKEAGADYVIGTRSRITNDRPIVGTYGVNDGGGGDKYYKGGNLLHTIRQLVDDDEKWRGILRGLNDTNRHQIVPGARVEEYITRHSGIDLQKVIDQYLRDVRVPVLEYRLEAGTLSYRWTNVVYGFDMPVRVTVEPDRYGWIHPTEGWQTLAVGLASAEEFRVDRNFYVEAREVR
ncbi:MAG: M1 family metallopeptidase [Gemmatimonadota bacterium]